MNYKKASNRVSLFYVGLLLILLPACLNAQGDTEMTAEAKDGMAIFQGEKVLKNGGPACITCHNVINDDVIPGGLYAKDLTDVYERFGVGLSGWLQAPDPPAMAISYNYNPLEEEERENLSAFLKFAYETKDSQTADSGYLYFITGSIVGLFVLLVIVQLMWSDRKKKMVKSDIFSRQNKAWDAKF